MIKTKQILWLSLPLLLILAACSGLKLPGTSTSTDTGSQQGQNQQGQPGQPFNMANQPVEQKLAMGTLKLEGTEKAITQEQAKNLLPLWKAVKALSASSSASPEEVNAVYKQIQDTMSADQVQAIKDLNLSQTDLQDLMKQYGVQPQMPGNMPTLSANQQATFQARRTSRSGNGSSTGGGNGGGFPGGEMGGPPPGGFPGGDFPGGGQAGSGQPNTQRTPRAQGTPGAGPGNRGGFRGGMNNMFVDPLIKLLQDRAGIQATPTAKK